MGKVDKAASAGVSRIMNAASLGGDVSQIGRSLAEGDVVGAGLATANAAADSAGLMDDISRTAKETANAAAKYAPRVMEGIKNSKAGKMMAAGANYIDDAAKAATNAIPILGKIAPAASAVAKGLSRIAPGLGVALETTLEGGNFRNEDGSLGNKSVRLAGASVGTGVAMGIGAGVGLATGVAAAPLAAAVVVGYAASEYTSIAIVYNEEAQRFKAKADKSHFKAMGTRFHDEMKKRGATFDADSRIDWMDKENYSRMKGILKEQTVKADERIKANSSYAPDWARWGDSVVEKKNAESDKQIFESAQAEMDRFQQEDLPQLQTTKQQLAKAQAEKEKQDNPAHRQGVSQVQGGASITPSEPVQAPLAVTANGRSPANNTQVRS